MLGICARLAGVASGALTLLAAWVVYQGPVPMVRPEPDIFRVVLPRPDPELRRKKQVKAAVIAGAGGLVILGSLLARSGAGQESRGYPKGA